jgi:uncharacterized membrane protein YagU involved in acid resistance
LIVCTDINKAFEKQYHITENQIDSFIFSIVRSMGYCVLSHDFNLNLLLIGVILTQL